MTSSRRGVIKIVNAADAVRPSTPVSARVLPARRNTLRQDAATEAALRLGLDTEPDLFNILIFNYTMKCPLACNYCCYGCSPKRTETMDLKLALDLVDQAAALGVFQQCGFTGGEPLIFYDEIMTITERMRDHHLPFSMISSCYWASTPQEARRVIGDLSKRGMAVFTASHDPSHENWVPAAYVRHAVDAAMENNVHVCLCASFYDDTQRLENIFPEYVGRGVDFVNRVVLPEVGFAAKRRGITPSSYPNAAPSTGTCYKRVYHDMTVFWDGAVYPCCSVYNRETPRISIGNAYRDSLAELWDRLEGSLLYRVLKRSGFAELYKLVECYDPSLTALLPKASDFVGACHLCHTVFKNPVVADRIFQVVERYETDQIRAVLSHVASANGADTLRSVVEQALNAAGESGHQLVIAEETRS